MKKHIKTLIFFIAFSSYYAIVYKNLEDWKQPYVINKDALKKKLTATQFFVTQNNYLEQPQTGEYINNWADGEYNCLVCNSNVFKSEDKFESMYWASFNKSSGFIAEVEGEELLPGEEFYTYEVKCGMCASFLGHSYNNGPNFEKEPELDKRFYINSNSLSFEPKKN